MSLRLPILVALAVLFTAPAVARSQPYAPSTTDEARALAGKTLPPQEKPSPVPPGIIVSTTDEARTLAGRMLPQSQPGPARMIEAAASTDEARAVAGGLLTVAPARRHEPVVN